MFYSGTFGSWKLLVSPVSLSSILEPDPFVSSLCIFAYYCLYQTQFLAYHIPACVLSHILQAVKQNNKPISHSVYIVCKIKMWLVEF